MLIILILQLLHVMHLGTLASIPSTGDPSEAIPVEVPEAVFLDSVGALEKYILEAVSVSSDLNQGKPRCISYFIFESLIYVLCLCTRVRS